MSLPEDPTTQSNWKEATSTHIDVVWSIDLDLKAIYGSATHTLLVNKEGLTGVVLDTQHLEIAKVEVDDDHTGVPFTLGEYDPVMGSALYILLPKPASKGQKLKVSIQYNTTSRGLALGWLEKEQTSGGKFPFLFSQCQPIYARSLLPIQDTPSVKITYSATVHSTLPVLLSALRVSPPVDGPPHDGKVIGKDRVTYVYNQPIPIPSYLIAIAAGNVQYKAFPAENGKDWKTGVWAEPETLEKSYQEFYDATPKFLAAAETILPPYRFGVYDLLVLPPAFPYGGMENPCISFLTPTLLTGDQTLVDVVVHELTHSWFGNGVTHANASHFWLNEGWTTYIERVLQQTLHTPAHRGFSFLINYKPLEDDLKKYEEQGKVKYQRLTIPFEKGEDPDDAYSSVPYEKGANFILHLENKLGGLDTFLPYVKDYVNTYIGKSITTEQWKEHLYAYWTKNGGEEKVKALDSVDWDAWLNGEGTELPVKMEYDTTLAKQAYDLADRWDKARDKEDPASAGFTDTDLKDFDGNQIVVFLQRLGSFKALPLSHVKYLGELYGVASSGNAEIRLVFHELALKDSGSASAKEYLPKTLDWVTGKEDNVVKGRMKFCRPLFSKAANVDYDYTVQNYVENKNVFHPIAQSQLEKDLGLA